MISAANAAEIKETLGGRLWDASVGTLSLAIEDGRGPQVSFPLPSGEPVTIAGTRSANAISISITSMGGKPIADLQLDGDRKQITLDIRDREAAAEIVEHLEPLLETVRESESSSREQAVIE